MHQRLMIAVFITRAELQMRAQKESNVVLPLSQNDALVLRIAREDDVVRVELIVCRVGDSLGENEAANQHRHHHETLAEQCPLARDVLAKQVDRPQRDARVDEPKEQGRAHHAELRHQ